MTGWTDLRHGIRMAAKNPAFTCAAVAVLGLGIAANMVVFTLVNGILLRELPFDAPDRIVDITVFNRDNARNPISSASYPDVRDWNQMARTFEGIAGADERTMNLSDETRPAERFRGAFVSATAFSLIGQRPLLGRDFRAEDDREGAAPVVILGHAVWQRRYQGDPAIVGRTIRVNGVPSTVIGVMPEDFGFPQVSSVWQPLVLLPPGDAQRIGASATSTPSGGCGRVSSLDQAGADLGSVMAALAARHPDEQPQPRAARARVQKRPGWPRVPHGGGPFGHGRVRAAHRLRERGEPAAVARGGPRPRSVGAHVARREPLADRAPAPRRRPCPGRDRGAGRPGALLPRRQGILERRGGHRTAVLAAVPVRHDRLRVPGGRVPGHHDRLRPAAGAAHVEDEPRRAAQRRGARRHRAARTALVRDTGRRTDRADAGAAGRCRGHGARHRRLQHDRGRCGHSRPAAAAARPAGSQVRRARTASRVLRAARRQAGVLRAERGHHRRGAAWRRRAAGAAVERRGGSLAGGPDSLHGDDRPALLRDHGQRPEGQGLRRGRRRTGTWRGHREPALRRAPLRRRRPAGPADPARGATLPGRHRRTPRPSG